MNDIATVRQQIISAFQSVPMPKSPLTVRQTRPDYDEERQSVELALAGKHWDVISESLFENVWPILSYLIAEAYAYYLQGLLLQALDNFGSASYDNVLMEITPAAWLIYEHGQDDQFDARTALLTPDQFCAVAAFLGLILTNDVVTSSAIEASVAMRLGWGRYECPTQRLFQEFDARLRHHEYPPIIDPTLAALVDEIRSAFADTPYPGDRNLLRDRGGHRQAITAMLLQGLDWRTMHPGFFASELMAWQLLSNEGFRYFLPAYLIADLLGACVLHRGPLQYVTYGFGHQELRPAVVEWEVEQMRAKMSEEEIHKIVEEMIEENRNLVKWFPFDEQRMALYTRSERVAIIHYMEFKAEQVESEANAIRAAIERYWLPSLEMSP